MKEIILSNGVKIPQIGLGTWFIDDDKVANAIIEAVKLGYRHVDTAQAYGNERGVGEGIRKCGVDRKELFITTKIEAELKDYKSAYDSVIKSSEVMGLDYLDLVIIHAPQPWMEFRGKNRFFKENIEVWKALEDLYDKGLVRAIGLSNFLIDDMENILTHCRVKPMVNQFLVHIRNTPFEVIDFCQKNEIAVEAYSPIGHGEILKDTEIKKIADKYGVSVSALCIKYCLELGTIALPKTASPAHMRDNVNVDFVLSKEDLDTLKSLDRIKDYGKSEMFPCYSEGK